MCRVNEKRLLRSRLLKFLLQQREFFIRIIYKFKTRFIRCLYGAMVARQTSISFAEYNLEAVGSSPTRDVFFELHL